MPMNRVQFQKGLSMVEFVRRYGTEVSCEAALAAKRWPGGFRCEVCGCSRHSRFLRGNTVLWQCSQCRHQASLRAGTVFEHSKLPLTTWFLAAYLLVQSKTNMAALELMRHLGVCYRTAWRLKHKLMQVMTRAESERKLHGFVQLDDAYLGGERNGGRAGRGSENKVPFVIAVSTNLEGHPRHMVATPLSGFTKDAIKIWGKQHLDSEAEVFTDGLGMFNGLCELGHAHTKLKKRTRRRRDTTEIEGASWVNTVLSNVKRALDGTYHAHLFAKYAHRYLSEAAWRFNRRFHLQGMLRALIRDSMACKPWAERRLRQVTAVAS